MTLLVFHTVQSKLAMYSYECLCFLDILCTNYLGLLNVEFNLVKLQECNNLIQHLENRFQPIAVSSYPLAEKYGLYQQ